MSDNLQNRAWHDNQYYVYDFDSFLERPDPTEFANDVSQAYPDTELAMAKYGLNARVGYQANDQARWELSAGLHDAITQRFNQASSMPLNFSYSDSRYVNLTGSLHGISTKISHNHGYGHVAYSLQYANAYDVIDVVVDYRWDMKQQPKGGSEE